MVAPAIIIIEMNSIGNKAYAELINLQSYLIKGDPI